jgi:hypothetical protein
MIIDLKKQALKHDDPHQAQNNNDQARTAHLMNQQR